MSDLMDTTEEVITTHPKVFIFVVLVAFVLATVSLAVFAQKTDLTAAIKEQQLALSTHVIEYESSIGELQNEVRNAVNMIGDLDRKAQERSILSEIRALDMEVYNLQSLPENELTSRDKDRIISLQSDLKEANNVLQKLQNRGARQ